MQCLNSCMAVPLSDKEIWRFIIAVVAIVVTICICCTCSEDKKSKYVL